MAACFFQRPKPALNLVPQPVSSHTPPKVPSTQKGTLSPSQALAHLLRLASRACKAQAASMTSPHATVPPWHQALPLWPDTLITQDCDTTLIWRCFCSDGLITAVLSVPDPNGPWHIKAEDAEISRPQKPFAPYKHAWEPLCTTPNDQNALWPRLAAVIAPGLSMQLCR